MPGLYYNLFSCILLVIYQESFPPKLLRMSFDFRRQGRSRVHISLTCIGIKASFSSICFRSSFVTQVNRCCNYQLMSKGNYGTVIKNVIRRTTTEVRMNSLSNLAIVVPSHPAHDAPAKSLLANLLSPDEERNPTNEDTTTNCCHLTIGHIVSMRVHPRVSVET